MKKFMAACAVVVFLGAATAQDKKDPPKDPPKTEAAKIDGTKLVGTWQVTTTSGELPKGSTIMFDKEMKIKVAVDFNNMKIELTGTYEVKGDKLMVKIKGPDGKEEEDTDTIKMLDDKKVVLVNKEGKELELEKAAPKK